MGLLWPGIIDASCSFGDAAKLQVSHVPVCVQTFAEVKEIF